MPNQIPTFALPGLMEITRPSLDAQRAVVALTVKRIQDSLWLGIPSVGPVMPGGVQPTWPLALVEMVFGEQLPIGVPSFTLSSAPTEGQGTVAVANATTWLFGVDPQALPLPLGLHYWELRTTDSQGNVNVYYAGTQLIAP